MSSDDIDNRFRHHSPTPERISDLENVREVLRTAAHALNAICPEGREKSLAITKLEEAMFHANASIARS